MSKAHLPFHIAGALFRIIYMVLLLYASIVYDETTLGALCTLLLLKEIADHYWRAMDDEYKLMLLDILEEVRK